MRRKPPSKKDLSAPAVLLANMFATIIAAEYMTFLTDAEYYAEQATANLEPIWFWDVNQVVLVWEYTSQDTILDYVNNPTFLLCRNSVLKDINWIDPKERGNVHDWSVILESYPDLMQELKDYGFWLVLDDLWELRKLKHLQPYIP